MITFDELLDLLAVLNTNTSPWYKDFLPMAGAAFGVLLGLSLNTLRDWFSEKKNKELYKELVKDELTIALEEAVLLARNISQIIDGIHNESLDKYLYIREINNMCFSEYYPKVIASYKCDERKLIHEAYANISFINAHHTKSFISDTEMMSDALKSFNKLDGIMLAISMLCLVYDKLYNGIDNGVYSVEEFLAKYNIDSKFYTEAHHREKAGA